MKEPKIITPSETPLAGDKTPSSPAAPHCILLVIAIFYASVSALRREGFYRVFDSDPS